MPCVLFYGVASEFRRRIVSGVAKQMFSVYNIKASIAFLICSYAIA
jgi:hypothetical protein